MVRFLIKLGLLFTISSVSFVSANETSLPERKDQADIDTLELVQIIWRTGDRAPIFDYPSDPFQGDYVWQPWATGLGGITKKGIDMHFNLGKYLRKRYEGFLSEVYNDREILVQSSDSDRAIMSALSNMAGLFPPSDQDAKSQWNSKLPWRPLPVHTIPKILDNFISFEAICPRLEELEKESVKTTPFAVSINGDHEIVKLCQYIKEKTRLKECNFKVISQLWDTLKIQKLYNITQLEWIPPVYDQMARLAPLIFDPRVIVHNEESKKVKAGPLLTYLTRNMNDHLNWTLTKPKMTVISGHSSTIATALGAINVFDTQIPDYSSTAIFELHKGESDNSPYHFLRVFLRNSTSVPPFEFVIPNCGYPCKLDKFQELFSNLILTEDKNWQNYCSSQTNQNNVKMSQESVTALPLVIPRPLPSESTKPISAEYFY